MATVYAHVKRINQYAYHINQSCSPGRLGSHHRGHQAWEGRKRESAKHPRSKSAWVRPAPATPRASPAPPAGAWLLARGLEVSSGAAPCAPPRRGLTGVGAATDPRPNRRGAPLTSIAARLGSRYARRLGPAATPTPSRSAPAAQAARPCPDPPRPLLPPAQTAPPPPRPLCSPHWLPASRPRPSTPSAPRIGQTEAEAARPQARSNGLVWHPGALRCLTANSDEVDFEKVSSDLDKKTRIPFQAPMSRLITVLTMQARLASNSQRCAS
ncbi:translation initiation factor IF-2-like [Mesocricetus auratus]|uniref:Translation initiation factor IF-2-like n=1 Tax=Mesocricetus auratus TaxID=10036 RepID=A0ABM2Y5P5_MESAU|nr:translation initiation factor IF-2-like [Mesocricetus auratus]